MQKSCSLTTGIPGRFLRKQRGASGFTLIELLVVMAIISLLSALLFPVFLQAREKARQITCVSNEKQIGLAMLQYAGDNDDVLPAGARVDSASVAPYGLGWAGTCWPYAKATAVFHCPDDGTSSHYTNGTLDGYPVSYGFNTNAAAQALAALTAPAKTVLVFEVTGDQALITNPSEGTQDYSRVSPSILLSAAGDGVSLAGGATGMADGVAEIGSDGAAPAVRYVTGATGDRFDTANAANYPLFAYAAGIHNGGANYLAADGHVEYLLPARVSSGQSAVAETDSQGASDDLVATPAGGTAPYAAGTANTQFTLTFSMR